MYECESGAFAPKAELTWTQFNKFTLNNFFSILWVLLKKKLCGK